jgi:hypothetical protein
VPEYQRKMTIPRHILSVKFHLPYRLSHVQQHFLLPYFGWKVLIDPTRGDIVAAIGAHSLNH